MCYVQATTRMHGTSENVVSNGTVQSAIKSRHLHMNVPRFNRSLLRATLFDRRGSNIANRSLRSSTTPCLRARSAMKVADADRCTRCATTTRFRAQRLTPKPCSPAAVAPFFAPTDCLPRRTPYRSSSKTGTERQVNARGRNTCVRACD